MRGVINTSLVRTERLSKIRMYMSRASGVWHTLDMAKRAGVIHDLASIIRPGVRMDRYAECPLTQGKWGGGLRGEGGVEKRGRTPVRQI